MSQKEKLLETAPFLFMKKGFHQVSIREIADSADVNVASISYHFGGKKGLFLAVINSFFELDLSVDLSVKNPANRQEMKEQLKHSIRMLINAYLKNKNLFYVYLTAIEEKEISKMEFYAGTFGKGYLNLKTYLVQCQNSGLISADVNVDLYMVQLVSPILSLMKNEKREEPFYPFTLDDAEFVNKFIDQLLVVL